MVNIYVSSGGGTKQPFGLLQVFFPSGTCECTNGSTVLSATSSPAMFAIPEAGTWTVNGTSGSESFTKTVEFTVQGQIETVKISYTLYIVSEAEGLAAGYSVAGNLSKSGKTVRITASETSTKAGGIRPAIDLTPYATMYIDAYWGAEYAGLGKTDSDWYTADAKIYPDTWARTTASLNVKSMSGLYFIKFWGEIWNTQITVYNLWLVPTT